MTDILTDALKSQLKPIGLLFPKPIKPPKKTMRDYIKKRTYQKLGVVDLTKKQHGTIKYGRVVPLVGSKHKKQSIPKVNLKKLRKECVDLAKLVAKTRDNFIDQRSGEKVSGSNCHGSHVIPVSHGNSLKYDPENIITLSYHNHINWWHKNPLEAGDWFKEKFPERYKYLEARKNLIVKYNAVDLQRIKEYLETQLKKYGKV